jgi:hypothetical protein
MSGAEPTDAMSQTAVAPGKTDAMSLKRIVEEYVNWLDDFQWKYSVDGVSTDLFKFTFRRRNGETVCVRVTVECCIDAEPTGVHPMSGYPEYEYSGGMSLWVSSDDWCGSTSSPWNDVDKLYTTITTYVDDEEAKLVSHEKLDEEDEEDETAQ